MAKKVILNHPLEGDFVATSDEGVITAAFKPDGRGDIKKTHDSDPDLVKRLNRDREQFKTLPLDVYDEDDWPEEKPGQELPAGQKKPASTPEEKK